MKRPTALAWLLLSMLAAPVMAQPAGAVQQPRPDVGYGVLYEANVRNFTEEGTLDALRARLPNLVDLGVRVLWLMPIQPIGQVHRVGELGSPYAVADYTSIDPAIGTEDDLDQLVIAAHARGILVIMDWVANHTAWDHVWTTRDPARYVRDEDGNFVPAKPEWQDVIKLDYDNPDTRREMIAAMRYWVVGHDIDGFRCDYAEGVPEAFWSEAISRLRVDRPLFMLAEGHEPWLAEAGFDAMYGWGLGDAVLGCVRGEGGAERVRDYLSKWVTPMQTMDHDPFRVHFTSQHDWNAWEGPAKERFGPAWEAATVLSYTVPGMPLIFNGQEAGLDRRLGFFEKDQIEWKKDPAGELYKKLGAMRVHNPAVRNGDPKAGFTEIDLGDESKVFAFVRRYLRSTVLVAVNLSPEPVDLKPRKQPRPMTDLDGNPATLPKSLPAWGWVVLEHRDGG